MTRDHLWQAIAIVAGVLVSSVPGIWYLASEVAAVREAAMEANATLGARVTAIEQRENSVERLEAEHHTDELQRTTTITSQLNAIIQSVAQAQVEIAKLTPTSRGK